MFRMPVSGTDVELRHATGEEDLLLLEGGRDMVSTSIELVRRLAFLSDGGELDAAALAVPDLEAVLLELRRRILGDVFATRGTCPEPECLTAIDLSFRISDYLRKHRARRPANTEQVEAEAKWFRVRGSGVDFRLVTAGDLALAASSAHPERELARLTIRSHGAGDGAARGGTRREERAMELLAPPLSGEIQGQCPECGSDVRFWFDVQSYVQRELRYDAEFLYEDVHQLASRYHWSEEEILSLPRQRRLRYVEMAMRHGGGS